MRKQLLLLVMTIGFAWQAHAQTTPYQLVGFSTRNFRGDAGIRGMTRGCQDDFGAAARMCTSTEVLQTVVWPQLDVNPAWLQPVLVSGSTGTDASGISASGPRLSCVGWAQVGTTGLTVDSQGSFRASDCNNNRRVACCAPVSLP